MSSYIGKHAEYYDLFYADKQYEAEADFLHGRIQFFKPGAKMVLELACGTGNHAFCLEKNYDLEAVDYSNEMIACAVNKASKMHSNVLFSVGDMKQLPSFSKEFDVVLCLFDSIGYVKTNEALNQVFQNVSKILVKDGLFIFEYWHAAAMLTQYDKKREKIFKTSNGLIKRVSETELNIKDQTASVNYKIEEIINSQIVHKIEETQVNRFFLYQEMLNFIEGNNFEVLAAYDGYSRKENVDINTWHIVSVCKKR